MTSSVICPKCSRESTGFFCACGADLRELFGRSTENATPAASPGSRRVAARDEASAPYAYAETGAPSAADGGIGLIGGAIGVVIVIGVIMMIMHSTGWFIFSFKIAKWIVLGTIAVVGGLLGTGGRGDGRG